MEDDKLTKQMLCKHPSRFIRIKIDSQCPLNTQLKLITNGDGWNVFDWTDTLSTGWIRHKKTGLIVQIL